jgi:mono/diheme cytochrome c family protein
MGMRSFWIAFALIPFATLSICSAQETIEYNRDIRPILAENCFACHGPDSAARKGDLRLDLRDAAIASKAIVEGKVSESAIIERILATDPDVVMPPPSTHKQIKPEQLELLKRWIENGAPYQPHWSFIPPVAVMPPATKNESWIKNPIDRFVLQRLESIGLEPAPEADRTTLARRAALDVTGLPPTPEMVDEFLKDTAADAYERYVDRLLQSDRWGEHRGRYWLDYARYADSHGIHFDNYREIWAYRDWVIKAFNANMPFDQFTIEQLAGDLLPNPTLDQKIATGFNRCNITTNEGGVIPEEYTVLYTRDRMETTSAVWMGLTANCAVCHDHKFDPISQRDTYSMAAFFNNTTQNTMDGNIKDTPPVIPVPLAEDRQRWSQIDPEITAAEQQLATRRAEAQTAFTAWNSNPETLQQYANPATPTNGLKFHLPLDEGQGKTLHFATENQVRRHLLPKETKWQAGAIAESGWVNQDDSVPQFADIGDFEKDKPFSIALWVKLADPNQAASLIARMDEASVYRGWDIWVESGKVGMHLVHKWPEDAFKTVTRDPLPLNRWNHIVINYDGTSQANGVSVYVNGEKKSMDAPVNVLKSTTRTTVPMKIGQRNSSAKTIGAGLQDLRIYDRLLTEAEAHELSGTARTGYLVQRGASRSEAEASELFDWYLAQKDEQFVKISQQIASLRQEKEAIRSRGTIAHVMNEKSEPAIAFILQRGEYDKRLDQVAADTPKILPPMAADLPRNRLGFAKWMMSVEHPLTARVTVNRYWQEAFGTGLVRTTGDLGVSGELPINQDLLDWLAIDFRDNGWDVKRLFRLMLTSATYRQAAEITDSKLVKDPDNRLLSRGPRFRMEAEMVRDYALFASGLLSSKIGGPSVKPYQPDGVWEAVAMIGSNTRDYVREKGENLYRRSMYTFWKRSAPPASMEIFNAPSRETCTVRRERTNTPLQALVTLNDPQFVEAARALAQLVMTNASDRDARLNLLSKRVLLRELTAEEREVVHQSLEDLTAHYKSQPEAAKELLKVGDHPVNVELDSAELAAWTMIANELFNLDETINK